MQRAAATSSSSSASWSSLSAAPAPPAAASSSSSAAPPAAASSSSSSSAAAAAAATAGSMYVRQNVAERFPPAILAVADELLSEAKEATSDKLQKWKGRYTKAEAELKRQKATLEKNSASLASGSKKITDATIDANRLAVEIAEKELARVAKKIEKQRAKISARKYGNVVSFIPPRDVRGAMLMLLAPGLTESPVFYLARLAALALRYPLSIYQLYERTQRGAAYRKGQKELVTQKELAHIDRKNVYGTVPGVVMALHKNSVSLERSHGGAAVDNIIARNVTHKLIAQAVLDMDKVGGGTVRVRIWTYGDDKYVPDQVVMLLQRLDAHWERVYNDVRATPSGSAERAEFRRLVAEMLVVGLSGRTTALQQTLPTVPWLQPSAQPVHGVSTRTMPLLLNQPAARRQTPLQRAMTHVHSVAYLLDGLSGAIEAALRALFLGTALPQNLAATFGEATQAVRPALLVADLLRRALQFLAKYAYDRSVSAAAPQPSAYEQFIVAAQAVANELRGHPLPDSVGPLARMGAARLDRAVAEGGGAADRYMAALPLVNECVVLLGDLVNGAPLDATMAEARGDILASRDGLATYARGDPRFVDIGAQLGVLALAVQIMPLAVYTQAKFANSDGENACRVLALALDAWVQVRTLSAQDNDDVEPRVVIGYVNGLSVQGAPVPEASLLKHERDLLVYRARRGLTAAAVPDDTTERVTACVARLVNQELLPQSLFMDWLHVVRGAVSGGGSDTPEEQQRQVDLRRFSVDILERFTLNDYDQYDAALFAFRSQLQQQRPPTQAGAVLQMLTMVQAQLAGLGAARVPDAIKWMHPVLTEPPETLKAIDDAILNAYGKNKFDAAQTLATVLRSAALTDVLTTRALAEFVLRKFSMVEVIYQRGDRNHAALAATQVQRLTAVEPIAAHWPTLLRVDTRVQDAALTLYLYGTDDVPQWPTFVDDVQLWLVGIEDVDLRNRLNAVHALSNRAERFSQPDGKKRRARALATTKVELKSVLRRRLDIVVPPHDDMPVTVDDALAVEAVAPLPKARLARHMRQMPAPQQPTPEPGELAPTPRDVAMPDAPASRAIIADMLVSPVRARDARIYIDTVTQTQRDALRACVLGAARRLLANGAAFYLEHGHIDLMRALSVSCAVLHDIRADLPDDVFTDDDKAVVASCLDSRCLLRLLYSGSDVSAIFNNIHVQNLLLTLRSRPKLYSGADQLAVLDRAYNRVAAYRTDSYLRNLSDDTRSMLMRVFVVFDLMAHYRFGFEFEKNAVRMDVITQEIRSVGILDTYLAVVESPIVRDLSVTIVNAYTPVLRYFLRALNTYYLGHLTQAGIVTMVVASPPPPLLSASTASTSSLQAAPVAVAPSTATAAAAALPQAVPPSPLPEPLPRPAPPPSSLSAAAAAAATPQPPLPALSADTKTSDPSPLAATAVAPVPTLFDDIDRAWQLDDDLLDDDMTAALLENKTFT